MKQAIRNFFLKVSLYKKTRIFVSFFVFVFFFFARPVNASIASWVGEGLVWAVYLIIGWIIQLVSLFIAEMLTHIIQILITVVQYNDFIFNDIVVTGWELARDISNMFFVVILLVMAIGTIFKAETYHYKRMLPRLFIVIILINFSKLITGFIIDGAQVLMLTFAAAVSPTVAGNLFKKFGIDSLYKINSVGSTSPGASAFEEAGGYRLLYLVMSMLLGFVMLVVAFFVVLVYLAIFLMRIIALWILIIISPIAFMLSTFSRGQSYYREWWDKFINYVISGPILMFFFWLALTAGTTTLNLQNLDDLNFSVGKLEAAGVSSKDIASQIGYSQAGTIENVTIFIVTTALLMGGLIAAQRVQVAGAGLAAQTTSSLKRNWGGLKPLTRPHRAAGRLAGSGAKSFGGYIAAETGARLGLPSLNEWKEGWAASKIKRRQDRRKIKRKAAAAWAESGIPGGGLVAAASSPEHFLQSYFRFKTIRPFAGHKLRQQMFGTKNKQDIAEIHQLEEERNRVQDELSTAFDGRDVGKQKIQEEETKRVTDQSLKDVYDARVVGDRDHDVIFERDKEKKLQPLEYMEYLKKEKKLDTSDYSSLTTAVDSAYNVNDSVIDSIAGTTDHTSNTWKSTKKKAESLAEANKEWDRRKTAWNEQNYRDSRVDGTFLSSIQNSASDPAGAGRVYYKDGKIQQDQIDLITDTTLKSRVQKHAEFLETQDKIASTAQLERGELIKRAVDARIDAMADPEKELADLGREELVTRAQKARQNANALKNNTTTVGTYAYTDKNGNTQMGHRNLLGDEDEAIREAKIKDVKRQREKARADLVLDPGNADLTNFISDLDAQLVELERKESITIPVEIIDPSTGDIVTQNQTVDRYVMTKEEQEKLNKSDDLKKMREERVRAQLKTADRLIQVAEQPAGVNEAKKAELTKRQKELTDRIGEKQLEAEQSRPLIDFQARREQRTDIAKEMADMQTDSWQELFAIYQDAVKKGDSIRAAAAMMKATRDGNENEFLNSLGYDSGAEGLKQLVSEEWIKSSREGGLGMERELAMNIANDITYAAEKGFHWGIARAISTDRAGRQQFQDSEMRNMEVLAEVRKLDFEQFMRRANRLAYGREVVPGETRDERIKNFAATGSRDFQLDSFGSTFLLENYDNFTSLINRGRFNINLGQQVSSPRNLRQLERLSFLASSREQFLNLIDKIRTEYSDTTPGATPFDRYRSAHSEVGY